MNVNLKTCVYNEHQNDIMKYFDKDKFNLMGFDIISQQGCYHDLFAYMSSNKIDIFVLDATDLERDRCSFVVEIVYSNFCKNIIIITDDKYLYDGVVCISNKNNNFDLMLSCMLFKMKKDLESKPYRNMQVIKSKICNLLLEFCFSSKSEAFNYFVEAIYRIFLNYPYKCHMMKIYDEVAKIYDKTAYAVEKSMRMALLNATKKATLLPSIQCNQKVKSLMTYDMSNKLITNIFASKIAEELNSIDCEQEQLKGVIYQ